PGLSGRHGQDARAPRQAEAQGSARRLARRIEMSDAPHLREPADDWLEAALRSDAAEMQAAYIDDAGFTRSVLSRLPPSVTLPAWRRPVVVALWTILVATLAFALPGVFEGAFRVLAGVVYGQRVTLAQAGIGMA